MDPHVLVIVAVVLVLAVLARRIRRRPLCPGGVDPLPHEWALAILRGEARRQGRAL